MHFSYPKKLHITVICLLAILLAGLTGTLAWYGSTEAQLPQIGGSVTYMAKYFESGDGTGSPKYDPATMGDSTGCAYEIKTAEQFYNLAWLQYLGYFNQPNENGVIPTTYFYLSADLDMRNYVLPPVGTTKYPFLGNFDGNGHTVSGLTVTNKVNNTDTPIKDLPYIITQGDADYEVADVEIIGLFGVVGSLDAPTTGSEPAAACGSYTYSSITNEVKNLYISGITVRTQTNQSLIGIAAGYVNGTVENVGVIGNTTIRIASVCLDENLTPNMSDFSLVGYCTEAYKVQNTTVTPNGSFDDNISGGGSGEGGFGNSIAMKDLFNRVYTIAGDNTNYPYNVSFNSSAYTSYVSAETRTYEYVGGELTNVALELTITQIGTEIKDYKYYSFGSGGSYFMRKSYDYLLYMCGYGNKSNVPSFPETKTVTIIETHDGAEVSRTTTTETAKNGRLCYFPINAAWEGNSIVEDPNNTGYFVGGAYNSAYGDLRIENYPLSYISTALGGNTSSFADANLQVITRTKDSGDFCLIEDFYNSASTTASDTLKNFVGTDSNGDVYIKSVEDLGLKRYYTEFDDSGNPTAGARVNLGATLANESVFYGIDFMDMKATDRAGYVITAPIVSIYGTTYRDYEMPEDCIDFRLAQSGYVSFFASEIFGGSSRNFFSLHEITRDGSTITDIKEIEKIYQKGSSYVYKYKDKAVPVGVTEADLVFDLQWITKIGSSGKLLKKAVYYFEIPLNAGEYALGSCSGGHSAFLMYLDIGANGDEGGGGGDTEPVESTMSATATQYSYPLGVDFLAGKTGLNDIQNSAAIRLPNGTAGDTGFERESNTITVTSDAGNTPQASYIKNGVTVLIDGTAATATPVAETVYLKKVTQTTGGVTTVSIYKGANETEINDLVLSFTYTAAGAPVSITYTLDMPGSTWNLVITASGADLAVTEVGTSGFAVTINGESVPGTAPPG